MNQQSKLCDGAETNDPSQRKPGNELENYYRSEHSNLSMINKTLQEQVIQQNKMIALFREQTRKIDRAFRKRGHKDLEMSINVMKDICAYPNDYLHNVEAEDTLDYSQTVVGRTFGGSNRPHG